ncbi:hypothetical protein [Methanoculleus sp.]|jgi:hypothetical protein|uniref:hypothetical protein n=1 Tax=Methanoculleus sp. TaxID=90427 RepID=UPI0025F8A194|nr:hypothetical protein [Methanoculleus sp.]MCK9319223.1 hypothetical protein [Methanoculleus sp.]
MSILTTRFKLLNREAELSSGLIAGGLENLKKINRSDSFYYEAFYALSIGIERLLKLLILVEGRPANLKKVGHNLRELFSIVEISFSEDSMEMAIIDFLSDFSNRNRYSILDTLSSNNEEISSEPIMDFYQTIGQFILEKHNFISFKYLINLQSSWINFFHIEEDFEENEDQMQMLLIPKKKEFIAKYTSMYIGRIINPVLERLREASYKDKDIPCLYEHFLYLSGDDNFFKSRKTFRRR